MPVVVRDREVVPPPRVRRELLRGVAGDDDSAVPGGAGGGDEGEAAFRGFQPRAGGVGWVCAAVDQSDGGGVPVAGGDQAQADGGDGREPRADR